MSIRSYFFSFLVATLAAGCDGGSGSNTGDDTTQDTASGWGCCQLTNQCTDAPRRSQCDAVGGVFHEGKECNGSTHRCE